MPKKILIVNAVAFFLVCMALPFLLLFGCSGPQIHEDKPQVAYAYGAGKLPND